MPAKPIIIEQSYNVSSDRVWKALTDNGQMHEWYFDIHSFVPEAGFEFSFTGGDEKKKYIHLCKIMEVVPSKKISYTWRYDGFEGNSLVSFELFDGNDHTRLKLTHAGLDTFPKIPDLSQENFLTGWNYILGTSLKEFLEKTAH